MRGRQRFDAFAQRRPRDRERVDLIRLAGTSVDAALVVAGHTHQQDDRGGGAARFVNAGSVGLPYEADGAARWVRVADGMPELRRTEYDAPGAGAQDPGRRPARCALGRCGAREPGRPARVTRIFEDLASG